MSRAQIHHFGAAAPGLVEVGAPAFSIREHEGLGLDSPPTDFHLLPDGRILAYGLRQLSIGDGIRWQTFFQAPNDPFIAGSHLAVDSNGDFYVGIRGGFGRIEFDENGYWRVQKIAHWKGDERREQPVLRTSIVVGDQWFWHGDSGPLIAWRPGQEPKVLGRSDTIEQVIQCGGKFYLSDRTNGQLSRIDPTGLTRVEFTSPLSTSDTITCAVPFDHDRVLVGSYGRGIRLFDGKTTQPFFTQNSLGEGTRINDLCATEAGYFAAAVENYGIVFFDRQGHTVQVLDRGLDHRLADVRRLVTAPGGMILGLLNDGLLRISFPSPVSHYDRLIGTGVTTAHPARFKGGLWLMADGNILRGVYDQSGRLTHIQVDSPPARFAFTFSCDLGVPITGTEHGAYYRNEYGWVEFAPESVNLRILDPKPINGRWVYGAKDEVGWIRFTGTGMEQERIPMPGLDNLYNTETDRDGSIWIEQGNAKLSRLRMNGPHGPTLETFGVKNGIPEGWAQAFSIDGDVRFNIGGQILRFDEEAKMFRADDAFHRQFAGLKDIIGRPGRDPLGRLWITANGSVQVLEPAGNGWRNLNVPMPSGFQPYYFAFEDKGIVWMHGEHHLARYDPSMPASAPAPFHALITNLSLSASGREIFPVGSELAPLKYEHNSLVLHFLAPNAPLGATVNFEVKLEGADSQWVATGPSGSAVYNHLKEGHYVLHVRPNAGGALGGEATLGLTIRPPWYRTTVAQISYVLCALMGIILVVRASSYLNRRENARLERLVTQRTHELNTTNERLASQVQEIRTLSQAIEQSPVAVYLIRSDHRIVFANPRACEMSGYSLNELVQLRAHDLREQPIPSALSAEIETTLRKSQAWRGQINNRRKDGRIIHVRSIVVPIRDSDGVLRHILIIEEDITDWLVEQERRRQLEAQLFQAQKLESLGTLAGGIAHDFNNILTGILGYCELARASAGDNPEVNQDLDGVRQAGLRARDLVSQILTFSRQSNVRLDPTNLAFPVSEAVKLVRASTPATVEIISSLENGTVCADATQIQQLVLNLCTNAVQALPDKTGRLEVTLQRVQVSEKLAAEVPNLKAGPALRLIVADNGMGMDQATLDRIFDPFFTTKKQGEGTGLGLAIVQGILAAHGGARRVRSAPGAGTTFELYFPITDDSIPPVTVAEPPVRGEHEEILVVDDEASVANYAGKRLEQLGYRVAVFTEPRAAVSAVAAAPKRFHAVVSDLTMPHLTGADLVQQIRAFGPMIPAVIVTGYGREATRAQLEALPCCVVLPKPYSGEELGRALKQVLAMGTEWQDAPEEHSRRMM